MFHHPAVGGETGVVTPGIFVGETVETHPIRSVIGLSGSRLGEFQLAQGLGETVAVSG